MKSKKAFCGHNYVSKKATVPMKSKKAYCTYEEQEGLLCPQLCKQEGLLYPWRARRLTVSTTM